MKIKGIRLKYIICKKGAYYWNPPVAYMRDGLPCQPQPLGKELPDVIRRANELNQDLLNWRAGHEVVSLLPGTLKWLFYQYQQSPEYNDKKQATRDGYDYNIKTLENYQRNGVVLGELNAVDINKPQAKHLYSDMRNNKGIYGANSLMRTMRLVYNWGIGDGLIEMPSNPFSGLRLTCPPARNIVWTANQVMAFWKQACKDGRRSVGLACRLAYELAQRATDIRQLRRSQYADGFFTLVQSKTGQRVRIPVISDDLRNEIENIATEYIITSELNRLPYKGTHFAHLFARIREDAGLPKELQFRDQRRTAMTELGDAGATDDEIRAVSGHATREVVKRYVRTTDKQAENAIAKRIKNSA